MLEFTQRKINLLFYFLKISTGLKFSQKNYMEFKGLESFIKWYIWALNVDFFFIYISFDLCIY